MLSRHALLFGVVLILEQCCQLHAQSVSALPNGSIAIQLASSTDTFMVQPGTAPAVDVLGVLAELSRNHTDVTGTIMANTSASIQAINITLNSLAATVTDNYETISSQANLISQLQDAQRDLQATIASMNQCATNGTESMYFFYVSISFGLSRFLNMMACSRLLPDTKRKLWFWAIL